MQTLTATNETLQEYIQEQEKDALQVLSAMHKTSEKKDSDILKLEAENKLLHDEVQKCKEVTELECKQKLDQLSSIIDEKEAANKIMKQDYSIILEFKVYGRLNQRKRQDLLKSLEETKIELRDTEKRNRANLLKMEKRFFEEKMKLQKEYKLKFEELAQKAHKEAVVGLDETTKDVYKENMRMSEALEYHVEEGVELKRLNEELHRRNRELVEENELHAVIVKEKVRQAKAQEDMVSLN